MQRAWVALFAGTLGCGFNASSNHGGADAGNGSNDAGAPDTAVQTCWTLTNSTDGADWSACTYEVARPAVNVTANQTIDTDAHTACVVITADVKRDATTTDHTDFCAVFATSITIAQGVTLSATGSLPLALFAPTIEIQGTLDVASHIGGQRGAASNSQGCNPETASHAGGGAGGTWSITGGAGGDQGGVANVNSGGDVGHGVSDKFLRGGCDGRRGGDGSTDGGPDGSGGAGGGAVWLSTSGGTLTIGPMGVINASGAAGAGAAIGPRGGHGGGSGGLIVLQSKTIHADASSQIFANGGHGGGGSDATTAGVDGSDSTGVRSTGMGGTGGGDAGAGGQGYPANQVQNVTGQAGNEGNTSGGGGGGGGGGVIRIDSDTHVMGPVLSPPAKAGG